VTALEWASGKLAPQILCVTSQPLEWDVSTSSLSNYAVNVLPFGFDSLFLVCFAQAQLLDAGVLARRQPSARHDGGVCSKQEYRPRLSPQSVQTQYDIGTALLWSSGNKINPQHSGPHHVLHCPHDCAYHWPGQTMVGSRRWTDQFKILHPRTTSSKIRGHSHSFQRLEFTLEGLTKGLKWCARFGEAVIFHGCSLA
jgi:hypothetical protein